MLISSQTCLHSLRRGVCTVEGKHIDPTIEHHCTTAARQHLLPALNGRSLTNHIVAFSTAGFGSSHSARMSLDYPVSVPEFACLPDRTSLSFLLRLLIAQVYPSFVSRWPHHGTIALALLSRDIVRSTGPRYKYRVSGSYSSEEDQAGMRTELARKLRPRFFFT